MSPARSPSPARSSCSIMTGTTPGPAGRNPWRAIALCRKHHRGADVENFEEWSADQTRLDDVWKPKDQTCLRGEHNEDLAKHLAVWEVIQAGRSMMSFVWALHACPELQDALAAPTG